MCNEDEDVSLVQVSLAGVPAKVVHASAKCIKVIAMPCNLSTPHTGDVVISDGIDEPIVGPDMFTYTAVSMLTFALLV